MLFLEARLYIPIRIHYRGRIAFHFSEHVQHICRQFSCTIVKMMRPGFLLAVRLQPLILQRTASFIVSSGNADFALDLTPA